MAAAVACAGIDTEPERARRLFSFRTRCKGLHTYGPWHCSNCDTYTRHFQGFENCRNLGLKGGDFLNGHHHPSSSEQEQGLTVLSRGSRDHWVVAAASIPQGVRGFTIAATALWLPEPAASRMEGGSQMRTWQGTNHCQG
jgi:hypothetical protein